MKKIYVCTPFFFEKDEDKARCCSWYKVFKKCIDTAWRNEFMVINPIEDDADGDIEIPVSRHISADIKVLLECDMVVAYDRWENNNVCKCEKKLADLFQIKWMNMSEFIEEYIEKLRFDNLSCCLDLCTTIYDISIKMAGEGVDNSALKFKSDNYCLKDYTIYLNDKNYYKIYFFMPEIESMVYKKGYGRKIRIRCDDDTEIDFEILKLIVFSVFKDGYLILNLDTSGHKKSIHYCFE